MVVELGLKTHATGSSLGSSSFYYPAWMEAKEGDGRLLVLTKWYVNTHTHRYPDHGQELQGWNYNKKAQIGNF